MSRRHHPVRERQEELERVHLHPRAARSAESRGRKRPEPPDPIRTSFQRDRDRIIHSKAFRRLKHKTQVFFAPLGDHYRTRLTHTLEVAQVARTITRALALNEDLAEAIALGHDLGHTPFGHAGERVLNKVRPGGFNHYRQSLRVVEVLENDGRGLNLTYEVKDGIVKHSKGRGGSPVPDSPRQRAKTLEGAAVRLADLVAYANHDVDDAVRAGVLRARELPARFRRLLGTTVSSRLNAMVTDIIQASLEIDLEQITMSQEMYDTLLALREFMFEHVYTAEGPRREFEKAERILTEIYAVIVKDPERYLEGFGNPEDRAELRAWDFVAGMTDRYAVAFFEDNFVPRPWASGR
ncbi:MAG: deoxyguanosinetriphosphate triphosphohydrolase [Acidobacteriota bacterium]